MYAHLFNANILYTVNDNYKENDDDWDYDNNSNGDGDGDDGDNYENEKSIDSNSNSINNSDGNDDGGVHRKELKTHYHFRQRARHNLELYTENMKNMMIKKNKRKKTFSIGDCVKIQVPKIDRQSTHRKYLLCKIINIFEEGMYQLACQCGILDICYSAADLEYVDNQDIPELQRTSTTRITVREAARLQNITNQNNNENNTVCNCKRNKCQTRTCSCKKNNTLCSIHCHRNKACLNKQI